MGSCVSSSHNKGSDSAVKLATLISKPEITTSPTKNDVITPSTINRYPPFDSGNKEEWMFLDSRGWLDSDSEDDFMSVDGEFTPSRETTPVEKKHEEEQSPTDNKKRLLELFKETEEEDDVAEGKARACLWPARSSAPATPYTNERERQQLKMMRSTVHGGCLPRLISCSSFSERRRKMMMTHTTSIDVQRLKIT